MANFAIYAQAQDLSALKVGASASPTSYTQISKTQRFSLPGGATDEVKLEYSATQTFNAVAITGLNSYPTITVTKTINGVDTVLDTVVGSHYALSTRARSTFNALITFTDELADSITISFSTPYATSFNTVFAGYLAFQPDTNFERGVNFTYRSEMDALQTRAATYHSTKSRLRQFNPKMALLSDEEYFDVEFVKSLIDDNNCLVVLDSADTDPEKWMIASLTGGSGSLVSERANSQSLNFLEAQKWIDTVLNPNRLTLLYDFYTSIPSDFTYTRTGSQTFLDHEDLLRTETVTNNPAFVGARRVENFIDNTVLPSDLGGGSSSASVSSGIYTLTPDTLNMRCRWGHASSGTNNNLYVGSMDIRLASGSGGEVQFEVNDEGLITYTPTSTWVKISVSRSENSAQRFIDLKFIDAGCVGSVFEVREVQLEDATGQANQNPSEYVTFGSPQYYDTANGNTVDGSGIVTEATGAALTTLKGVLLEPQAATNLLTYSEQFDNAAWLKTNASVTANSTTAPDGKLTADKLLDSSAGGTAQTRLRNAVTVSSGSSTFSIYAKKDQLDYINLFSANFDAGGNGNTWFNLSTGVVGTTSANHTAKIEQVANGWYRCSITFSTTTDLAGNFYIQPASADGVSTIELDGTSSIFIWGAQVELGGHSLSYIKTEASTVTRNATRLSATKVFNGNALSVQMKFTPNFDADDVKASAYKALALSSTTDASTNYYSLEFNATAQDIYSKRIVGGVTSGSITDAGYAYSSGDEINWRIRGGTSSALSQWVNARTVVTEGSPVTASFTETMDLINIAGDYAGINGAPITVSELKIWSVIKSDAFLEALT